MPLDAERLSVKPIEENVSDRHPPLADLKALASADRRYLRKDPSRVTNRQPLEKAPATGKILGIVGKGMTATSGSVEVRLTYTRMGEKGLETAGETVALEADHALLAIGQALDCPIDLGIDGAQLAVDAEGRTSESGISAT